MIKRPVWRRGTRSAVLQRVHSLAPRVQSRGPCSIRQIFRTPTFLRHSVPRCQYCNLAKNARLQKELSLFLRPVGMTVILHTPKRNEKVLNSLKINPEPFPLNSQGTKTRSLDHIVLENPRIVSSGPSGGNGLSSPQSNLRLPRIPGTSRQRETTHQSVNF